LQSRKTLLAGALAAAATGAAAIGISVSAASSSGPVAPATPAAQIATSDAVPTATPIKHVVVLFDENVSFDHYFATYPYAENQPGEPAFHALPDTPSVNGLDNTLLEANPNLNDPQRLSPSQALTCDQNHGYSPEQTAFDDGLMDKFVQSTTGGGCTQSNDPDSGSYGPNGIVMDYYDGNTVTGLWNLAQHFTLNDNNYGTQFGPSSPGAINVISGDTNGAQINNATATDTGTSAVANGTLYGDIDPSFDECSNSSAAPSAPGEAGGVTGQLTGRNIGDLLNTRDLTWGWFQGGFTPSSYIGSGPDAQPVCASTHTNIGGATVDDYSPHHEPFQYYASTSNPYHLSPDDTGQVGTSFPSGVNHQYDLSWFNQDVASGNLPAVSYLKAPEYEDGHAGYSDPLDEQRFIVDEVNAIEQSPDWANTAIFITYDDSDGWYDHQMGPIIRGSQSAQDTLNATGVCGSTTDSSLTTQDRCGVGPRLPLLVISPWAKTNYVDSTFTEQASIPAFIEDNWNLGRIGGGSADTAAGTLMNAFDFDQSYGHAPAIIMNDTTGEVEQTIPAAAAAPSTGTAVTSSTSTTTTTSTSTSTPGLAPTQPTQPGSAGSGQVPRKATPPHLIITVGADRRTVRVTVRTRGGSDVSTSVRLRLRQGRRMLADRALTVRDHRATFVLTRGARIHDGRYRVTMTVDAGGSAAAVTRTFQIG
jgi:phospholipase C